MDATSSEEKKNILTAINDGALFSDDELALLNNSVYSLEPFDTAEIDGILNSYNYGSSHETNNADFPPSWNDTEIENTSNDFLNGGIDYGNLLSSCIDNASGPINPANDLLSLDLLQEQPYELILPYEPEPDHETKTDEHNVIEFDWDDFMVHSPKSTENTQSIDKKCAVDNKPVVVTTPGELGELQQNLVTKFESLKYYEVHQCDFNIDDKEAEEAAAAAASTSNLPKTMDNLRQYHVFLMPLDIEVDYETSMQSIREKFHKNPLVVDSLISQSLDIEKQSKLIIPFKPKLVEYPTEQKTRNNPNADVIEYDSNEATRMKRCRKQSVKLTEPLKTRNEISDVLEALRNAADSRETEKTGAGKPDSVKILRPSSEQKGRNEKNPAKMKKQPEQKVTKFRCSERIQQRRRKTRVHTLTKRHESEGQSANDSAKSNQQSTEPNY